MCFTAKSLSGWVKDVFSPETDLNDREVRELIEATLDRENPRRWYFALYDYGAYLKKLVIESY